MASASISTTFFFFFEATYNSIILGWFVLVCSVLQGLFLILVIDVRKKQ